MAEQRDNAERPDGFAAGWDLADEDEEALSEESSQEESAEARARRMAREADLAEEFMPRAEEIAREMDDGTIPIEDLIQEAYVGMTRALKEIARASAIRDADPYGMDADSFSAGRSVDETMERAIRDAVTEAQKAQNELRMRDDKLIVQVERLNKSIEKLTEELGAKPTVDELANDLNVTQDKVLDILKLTGENTGET